MTGSHRSSSSARPTTGSTPRSSSAGTTAWSNSSSAPPSSVPSTYEPALLRHIFRGRVWNAIAALVVEDTAAGTVLWLPPGFRYRMGDDLFGDWSYRDRVGRRPELRITRNDDPFSVFLFHHEDGTLRGWYVNLERPQTRTARGFDYEDELLDVWTPVGGTPELLDEDELAEAVTRGFVTPDRAAQIRANAERVLADPPWPTGWEDWTPTPGWQVPDLPLEWDV